MRRLRSVPPSFPQPPTSDDGLRQQPATVVGRTVNSPWMDTREAAEYVRCPSREAFRTWARRKGITFLKRGRALLVARADLDRALGVKTVRHGRRIA